MTKANNRSVYSTDMNRLIDLYKMEVKGHLLINGRCPRCGRRSLFAYVEHPQLVLCGARVQCGWVEELASPHPERSVMFAPDEVDQTLDEMADMMDGATLCAEQLRRVIDAPNETDSMAVCRSMALLCRAMLGQGNLAYGRLVDRRTGFK